MTDFPLIKGLQNPEKDEKTPLPRGIKYAKFDVIVENEEMTVHVPEREAAGFEQEIAKAELSRYDFKQILRKYRGVRG